MNKKIIFIWAVSLVILSILDMISTYCSIGSYVVENNFIVRWGIETFGPKVGIFFIGGAIKQVYLNFLFVAFWICFMIANSIEQPIIRQLMRGFLFGAMFIPHFANLFVIIGNFQITNKM